jgi:hypothetical protein
MVAPNGTHAVVPAGGYWHRNHRGMRDIARINLPRRWRPAAVRRGDLADAISRRLILASKT